MTAESAWEQTLIVNDRVVRINIDRTNVPESMSIEVEVDGRRVRGWEEPGWRHLSLGLSTGALYWWSARRLVAITLDPPAVEDEISWDEDVLAAFGLGEDGDHHWLIISESAISMVRGSAVVSRLEFGEVVTRFLKQGSVVEIETADGRMSSVMVGPDGLQTR